MHSAGIANQSSFSRVNSPAPQRSVIPISSTRKTTMDSGYLVPIYHQFCLPGDVWNLNIAMFGRLLTLKFPLMDNLILEWFAFFEPERLLWNNFEKMQGYQANPGDSTDYVFPYLYGEDDNYIVVEHDVGDYFGLPLGVNIDSDAWHLRSGPFRAYRDIWNNWFRDQNYQDSLNISGSPLPEDERGDGPDDYAIVSTLLRRNKRPDYFSSSLKEPQKGPAVPIPWSNDGLAPVIGDGFTVGWTTDVVNMGMGVSDPDVNGQRTFRGDTDLLDVPVNTSVAFETINAPTSLRGVGLIEDPALSHIVADIGSISASINQLRESVVLQQIYELDARGGTRYTEALKNRWDVDAEDYRLQRPEFIASGSSQFSVSQVAQNSPTSGTNAMASLAAYSELRTTGHVSYTCIEHGHLLILVNVRAPLTYQQGLNRKWLAESRFDLPEPLTMNLGERAVMQSEIFFPPTTPETVWGYQEIWAEYRYDPSFVSGKFRSAATGSLDAWHLALDYEEPPVHNGDWTYDNPPVSRVVAFEDQPELKLDFLARGRVARKMPVVSIPGLLRF